MSTILFIFSIIYILWNLIKEKLEPTIPAENWGNMDLYYEDRRLGMSSKELLKNVRDGRYILPPKTTPEPHRDEKGNPIIENSGLYLSDCKKYGALKAQKWLYDGKYNLSDEELLIQKIELQKKYNSYGRQ